MSFPKMKLGECAEIHSGSTPRTNNPDFWDGDITWVTPKDLSKLKSKFISKTESKITQLGFDSCSTKLLPENSVLFSSRAPIGHVAINTIPMCTNQGFKSFVPKADLLDSQYLYYWLKANKEYLQDLGVGATFKEISKTVIANVEIPLPPLAEQRRIASILDQADELRQKRQQAIEKLDQLLQAAFIDMFGDPVSNPKGWDLYKLSDLGSISTGNTPSRDDADNFGNYLEWIKSDNLNNDEDYATTATEYLSEKGAKKGRVVPEGSILVTCIAGSFDCIGNLAMVERKVSFNQQINSITPNDTVILEFLYYLMKISKPIIQNASTNSMKGMISKSKFSEILLPIPSKEKQIQFVELFKKLYGLKVSHKLYLNNADSLFKSLQNQAFNGTL
ncbi:restriction endonuclease subunit S [Acinetobacter lwoffii]|uniref:restriction endonuclease subunit S n=1 Tax=Acinetobacter lwoffii TaxID=28090 RepID=UPI003F8D1B09